MPDADDHWQELIDGLRAGDAEMARRFCAQYAPALQRVAGRRIAPRVRRRFDSEDVVQSVLRTFLRRASEGEFSLEDDAGLWGLLCAITLTKVREKVRFHSRAKRGLAREAVDAAGGAAVAGGPSPAELAEFTDQLEALLAPLEEEERRIVELKLDGRTNEQVGETMGCSERTVRRTLNRLRSRFEALLDSSG